MNQQAALTTRETERRLADDEELRQVLRQQARASVQTPRPPAPTATAVLGQSMVTGQLGAGATATPAQELQPGGPDMERATAAPASAQPQQGRQAGPMGSAGGERTANTRAAGGAQDSPDADLQRYLNQTAPKAIQALIKQGRLDEAGKFSKFVESQEGQRYARSWVQGIRALESGNHAAALKNFERLYNEQVPDGMTVRFTQQDGENYLIEQLDASGQVTGSKTAPLASLAQAAGLALTPYEAAKHYADRAATREKEDLLLKRETLRQTALDNRNAANQRANDERLDRRLEAQSRDLERRLERRGGLTVQQERQNAEIDAARERVAGLSPEELRRRTAKTTDTGRENADFDPTLARAAALAGRRKIGDDPDFDARQSPIQAQRPPQGQTIDRTEVAKRFRADKAMNNYTLGKETPRGIEVLDRGKVVGYFN